MQEAKQWYVVYTKKGREKRVGEIFSRKKIENYCPQQTTTISQFWNDQKVEIRTSLFSSLVFVKAVEADLEKLRQTSGVINFLYRLNKPAVIHDEEIETIQRFLKQYRLVRPEKIAVDCQFKLQDSNGNIYNGLVQKRSEMVALPSLGYCLVGEEKLEPVEATRFLVPKPDYSYFNYAGTILRSAGERLKQVRYKFFHS